MGAMYAVDAESGKQKWKFDVKRGFFARSFRWSGFMRMTEMFMPWELRMGQLKWKFKTDGERRFAGKHLHGVEPQQVKRCRTLLTYISHRRWTERRGIFGSGDGNIYSLNEQSGTNWKFKNR